MKFTSAHHMSAPLAMLALLLAPTHLLAQTATETTPQADINSMPKWSEFPVPPTNITTPAEFQAAVTDTLAKRQQLKTETDALVWDDIVPETFAADARGRIDPAHTAPIEAQTTTPAQINALAEDLRKRAAPPPVIK
ncbi:hypothetical protein [Asticcacaulis taihuensis]|uniref:hypothetical protein n=1 Tax=Asticcacaulis taihuensis TaxID=260084 RepID=UPI003F7B8CD2